MKGKSPLVPMISKNIEKARGVFGHRFLLTIEGMSMLLA